MQNWLPISSCFKVEFEDSLDHTIQSYEQFVLLNHNFVKLDAIDRPILKEETWQLSLYRMVQLSFCSHLQTWLNFALFARNE